MKKKTRFIVIIVSIFSLSLLVLAPINAGKPVIYQNYRPDVEKKPGFPRQNQMVELDSQATLTVPRQPSVWGIFVIATVSGVDGGIKCGLIQIPLLKGIDLDLMAGIKQAGFGLSKHVYRNMGLGLAGTITYGTGAKNLGIYGKCSF